MLGTVALNPTMQDSLVLVCSESMARDQAGSGGGGGRRGVGLGKGGSSLSSVGFVISCLHTGRALVLLGSFYSPAIVSLVYVRMSGSHPCTPFLLTDC